MAYEVRPDGTIIAPDEQSALRLSKLLRSAQQASTSASALPAPDREDAAGVADPLLPTRRSRPSRNAKAVRARVKAMQNTLISSAGNGVLTEKLAEAMRIRSSKGVSPYAILLRQAIEEKIPGQGPKAIWKEKGPEGTIWFANPEILKQIVV